MTRLPESRRILNARTFAASWNPADADPVQWYPRPMSRMVTAAYAVVCFGAAGLIGWLAYKGL